MSNPPPALPTRTSLPPSSGIVIESFPSDLVGPPRTPKSYVTLYHIETAPPLVDQTGLITFTSMSAMAVETGGATMYAVDEEFGFQEPGTTKGAQMLPFVLHGTMIQDSKGYRISRDANPVAPTISGFAEDCQFEHTSAAGPGSCVRREWALDATSTRTITYIGAKQIMLLENTGSPPLLAASVTSSVPPSISNTPPIAESVGTFKSGPPMGAIVGGVVGCVGLLFGVFCVWFYFRRMRHATRPPDIPAADVESPSTEGVTPYPPEKSPSPNVNTHSKAGLNFSSIPSTRSTAWPTNSGASSSSTMHKPGPISPTTFPSSGPSELHSNPDDDQPPQYASVYNGG